MSRLLALILGTGTALAVLWPCLSPSPFADDSYPLSTYPMFARSMEKREIAFADGVSADGKEQRLGPEFVANDEPMQAQRTLRLAVRSGRPAMRALCGRIAERVAQSAEHGAVTRVRIVNGLFDPVKYFAEQAVPEKREVLFECRVRRSK